MTNELTRILAHNSYPGRGVLCGQSADGRHAVVAYFIMGRSANSRNRVFVADGAGVKILPFDESKCSDPSLIIYSPIRVLGDKTIVSNGDQTDTIYAYLEKGSTFEDALRTRMFEPDKPNFTPRVSGIVKLKPDFNYALSILKRGRATGDACQRFTFEYEPRPGIGHLLHTYQSDGAPLPCFAGEPVEVALADSIDELAKALWQALDEDNKVSLAVRYIDLSTGGFVQRLVNKNR